MAISWTQISQWHGRNLKPNGSRNLTEWQASLGLNRKVDFLMGNKVIMSSILRRDFNLYKKIANWFKHCTIEIGIKKV